MYRAPLCPSSGAREYYTDGRCLWYLVFWFSSCRYGVELRVMCPVCRQQPEQASNKICNKYHLLHLVVILFPHMVVKSSVYKPGQVLMLSGGTFSQISRKSTLVGGTFVSPMHRPSLLSRKYFSYRLSRPQSHSAAGRIKSMKNPNDAIGNRTCGIPACSGVLHTTALLRVRWVIHTTMIRVQRTYYGGLKCH